MTTLKSITYYNDQIVKGEILSDSGHEYIVSYDGDSKVGWCPCPSSIFKSYSKDYCKHVHCLLGQVDLTKMKPTKRFENFPCGCTTIDLLMGNGFPLGSVTAIFGQSGNGKTLLSAQLALSCIKNLGKDVIIIETEGNREQDYLELLGRFKDRWGITTEEISKHIHFYSVVGDFQSQAIITLLKMVGYETTMDQSKGGDKYAVTFKDCKPGLKEEELKASGLLIIDSLTKPIKTSIGSKTQNLPSRAELIARFFGRIYQLAFNYNLGVVINHHASCNPVVPFGRDFGNPYGGDEIFYNSKYIVEIINSDMAARAKFGQGARRVVLVKHPYQPVDKELHTVNLKENWGFTDDE
jgi:RecA/RadA recombinase